MSQDSQQNNGSVLELLTVSEVAKRLRIKTRTVHKLCRERRLSYVLVTPRERRFTSEQIEAFIASKTIEPPKLVDRNSPGRLPSPKKSSRKTGGDRSTGDSSVRRKLLKERMREWQS